MRAIFLSLVLAVSVFGADNIRVYFSPNGGCTEAVVGVLNKAKSSVLMQAYTFTSAPIAKALVEAKKRSINVQVILDRSNLTDKYSACDFLVHAGIPTRIDAKHAIAHNKVMIVDRETVVTGSFNFTKAAESSNAENLLVIQDKDLAEQYIRNWLEHYKHSDIYQAK